jgi:hypothetical protein
MQIIKLTNLIDREVERLFSVRLFDDRPARYGDNCRNPVTGANYIHGEDPIKPQKEAARRALLAREWFAINGPADAQPLPLWCDEGANHEEDGWLLRYIVGLYARSLGGQSYDVRKHPTFADYVSGVLWEAGRGDGGVLPNCPDELPKLKKRFPPRRLPGMGPGFCWLTPKEYAEDRRYRRRMAWKRSYRESAGADSITTPAAHPTPTESMHIPESARHAAARANSYYQRPDSQSQPKPEN